MPSETESLAVQLVRALFNASGGLPHEWRMLEELDGATTDAIEFAAARGWVAIQGNIPSASPMPADAWWNRDSQNPDHVSVPVGAPVTPAVTIAPVAGSICPTCQRRVPARLSAAERQRAYRKRQREQRQGLAGD